MIFPFHRNPKDIDPSYKTELGFFSSFVYVCVGIFVQGGGGMWDGVGMGMCNQQSYNIVVQSVFHTFIQIISKL